MANHREDALLRTTDAGFGRKSPLKAFFLERHADSYRLALAEFVAAVAEGRRPSATQADGRNALVIARACEASRRSG